MSHRRAASESSVVLGINRIFRLSVRAIAIGFIRFESSTSASDLLSVWDSLEVLKTLLRLLAVAVDETRDRNEDLSMEA
jgi:hypothetical protein